MTKKQAMWPLGTQIVAPTMGEYLAIALLLIHERAQGEDREKRGA